MNPEPVVPISALEHHLYCPRQRLIVELCDVIDFGLDSVNVYKFDGPLARARTSLGRKVGNDPGEPWFV